MRRLLLTALAAITLAAPAWAGTGNWPAGLQTYSFQEGVYPTSAYTGCADTYVHNDSSGVDLSIRNYGASHQLCTTDQLYSGGEQAFMIKFLFLSSDGITGGIPANFVCTYARLSIYKINSAADAGAVDETNRLVYCYRSLYTWTEGTGTGAANGLANYDTASTGTPWVFDDANPNNQKWRPGTRLEATDANTDSSSANGSSFFGTDTLYQSVYNASGLVADGDYNSIPVNPTDVGRAKSVLGGGAARRLGVSYFDVTHDVSLMIAGQIKNNGWIFTNSESGLLAPTCFASSEYTASKTYRPKLEIWGYTISSGGTTGRRNMGGGTR